MIPVEFPYEELPPNHRALVDLIKTLSVGEIRDDGDSIIIRYADGKKTLVVRLDNKNVPRNGN